MAKRPYYEYVGEAWNDPRHVKTALGTDDLDYAASVLYDADDDEPGEIRDPKDRDSFDTGSPLDWAGDKAMGPIISKWGEGVKAGERMGKSAKNVEKTFTDLAKPKTKVEFHRTFAENAPSIDKEGLKIRNKNSGANTADQQNFPPMNWMADNPDNIPVANRTVGGFSVRHSPEIETYKMEMPLDKYNKTKRYKLVDKGHGRRAEEVAPGQQSMSKDKSRRTGSVGIDLIGEDIDPKYLTRLPKIPKDELDEAERFVDWATSDNDNIRQMTTRNTKKLPKQLYVDIKKAKEAINSHEAESALPEIRRVMKEWPQYRGGRDVPDSFDWDKYNQLKMEEAVSSPRELATLAFKPGTLVKKPWNEDLKKYFPEDVYEKFNNGSISRGVDIDYQRDANFRNANQGKKFAKEARESGNSMKQELANHHYGTIKDAIKGDPDSAYGKYAKDVKETGDYAKLSADRIWEAIENKAMGIEPWAERYHSYDELYSHFLDEQLDRIFKGKNEYVKNFFKRQYLGGRL